MKALVGTVNQEKFSVIVKTDCGTDGAVPTTLLQVPAWPGSVVNEEN